MKAHRRVLVIDHSPRERARLIEPLRTAGYDVAWADSAADGASVFGTFAPHLVFIAARLPRTHGTVLCRELKRTDAGTETPIVLVVEGAEVQIDLPPLDQFGADRLLRKPVSRAEILEVAETFLQDPDETLPGRVEETGLADPGDGLAHALEELDNVDFDLPDEIVNGPKGASAQPAGPVPVSKDPGTDIDDRLDHLFGGDETTPEPKPRREATTDTTRAKSRRTAEVEPPPEPRPAPPPAAQLASRPASEPAAPVSSRVVGPYQTAVLTRNRPEHAPAAATAPRSSNVRRWSLAAVSATVILVALAYSWLERRAPAPVDLVERETAAATRQEAAAPHAVAATLPPIEAEDPPSTHWADDTTTTAKTQAEPEEQPVAEAPAIEAPVARESKAEPPREIVRTREPEPQPAPVQPADRQPTVEQPVVRQPVVERTPAPEPVPVAKEPEVTSPPPSAEVEEPVPETPPAEPVTRPPLLLQRVEPRLTPKQLKDGPGEVVLRVLVSERGTVSRVVVERGIPGSPLESEAVAAVLRWRYEPALERDVPVEAWVTTTFVYD